MTEVVKILSPGEAQRLTQQIKLTASGVRNGLFKLRNLIDEAKASNVWNILGYPSWTAYLVDALGDEPLRVSRDERHEIVGFLAGEGLSTRAIAPIVGVDNATVHRDLGRVADATPDTAVTGEVTPAVTREVTGLDGKTYPQPETRKPTRRPLVDAARDAGWELRRAMERLERIGADDRLSRNRENVADQLRGHLTYVQESLPALMHLIEGDTHA